MSLLVPNAGEIELLKRTLFGNGGAITSSTNAVPIVVTTSANHGLSVNDRIVITDHLVNTNANGTFVISAVTANTFTLTGTTGNGVGAATGFWSLADIENSTLNLYTNNKTPAETDTFSSYTLVVAGWYAAKTLNSKCSTSAGWTIPTTVAPTGSWAPAGNTNVAEATYVQQQWLPTTSQSVYGYVINGATSTTIWWAELFASVKNLVNGDTLNLTPRAGGAHS